MTKADLWTNPDFCMELVPSVTVWEHLSDWKPTDFELAALISHMEVPLEQMEAYLKVIALETGDEELRRQIQDFIQCRERGFALFSENNGDYVYALKLLREDEEVFGYFGAFNEASEVGRQARAPFELEKYPLGQRRKQVVGSFNPFMGGNKQGEETLIYSEGGTIHPIGVIRCNEEGEAMSWWMAPDADPMLSAEEAVRRDYDPSLFQNAYVALPNPFERGDIVATFDRSGEVERYGIVATSQQEWQEFNRRVKNLRGADFFDAFIIVEFIDSRGDFSHNHIDPFHLTKCLPADRATKDYLLAGQALLRGKGSLEEFCMAREFYRKAHHVPLGEVPPYLAHMDGFPEEETP